MRIELLNQVLVLLDLSVPIGYLLSEVIDLDRQAGTSSFPAFILFSGLSDLQFTHRQGLLDLTDSEQILVALAHFDSKDLVESLDLLSQQHHSALHFIVPVLHDSYVVQLHLDLRVSGSPLVNLLLFAFDDHVQLAAPVLYKDELILLVVARASFLVKGYFNFFELVNAVR